MASGDFFGGFDGAQAVSGDPFAADDVPPAVSGDPFATDEDDANVRAFSVGEPDTGADVFSSAARSLSADQGLHSPVEHPFGDENEARQSFDEESPLSVWQAKRKVELAAKVEEYRGAKVKAVEDAKLEIEEFTRNRDKTIETRKSQNRAAEKSFRTDLDSVMQHGTLWEKVAKLVDLKPKSGKDDQATGRMRNLLVQLKGQKEMPGTA